MLIVISVVFIIANGNTYTIKYDNLNGISKIEDSNITVEDENIVKCIDKNIENGVLKVKIKSNLEGKTYIDIQDLEGNFSEMSIIYVHKQGNKTIYEIDVKSNSFDINKK